MTKLYWRIRIFFLALRWLPQVNLGDEVWYNNKKYTVCNGVRSGSWRLDKLDNGNDGWVPRKDCKKVISFDNLKHSFLYGYRFYMTSWFDIWCHNGIKTWMKRCNIWPWPSK